MALINHSTSSSESTIPAGVQTDGEVHFLAQALDYYRAVQRAGKEAPFGQFLDRVEAAVEKEGRELLRQSLESITQEAADEIKILDAGKLSANKCAINYLRTPVGFQQVIQSLTKGKIWLESQSHTWWCNW